MYLSEQLKDRTKKFAVEAIKFYQKTPKTDESKIILRQVLRSATSVGANYRATCRARSKAEFISKLGIVVEEVDETVYWLELLIESELVKKELVIDFLGEANELLAIFAASRHTAKKNK